jgi:hypothetical protein
MSNRVCPDGNGHLTGREEGHGWKGFISRLKMGHSDFIASLVEGGLPW